MWSINEKLECDGFGSDPDCTGEVRRKRPVTKYIGSISHKHSVKLF